jgi:acyl-CoA synthetase (AMP-forming)/AMP-acid ligase II
VLTGLTPEGFAAHVAAHAVGCLVAAIRPAWSAAQLAGVLGDGIDAVVGDATRLTPEVGRLAAGLEVLSVDDLLAADDPGSIDVTARPDDLARVNFTSGSTGRPKGCAYTYRTLSLGYTPDRRSPELARLVAGFDRMLVHGSWAMPVMFTFAGRCLLRGGTVVIADEVGGRPIVPFALERDRITGVAMTPPMLQQMLAVLRHEPVNLDALRALVVTGSPASADLLTAAADRLGPVVWQGYGQAESGMISLLTPEEIDLAPSSVGRPLPDVEVWVEAKDGQGAGEIHVRSPYGMAQYWGDPDGTAAVIAGGWLNTRDVGWLDPDGRLHLTGRSREVIVVNGEVCYAAAIERALMTHPAVAQAHVVGAPDERTGEAVHAFIVPVDGSTPPALAVFATLIRAELTAAHVPATVTVLDHFPLTPGSKPDKHALAALVRSHRDGGVGRR